MSVGKSQAFIPHAFAFVAVALDARHYAYSIMSCFDTCYGMQVETWYRTPGHQDTRTPVLRIHQEHPIGNAGLALHPTL